MAKQLDEHLLTEQNVSKALRYIEKYWKKLERYNPHDQDSLIGLPHPYLVPSSDISSGFVFEEQYYWDSYFTMQGLFGTNREQYALYMLENLLHLMKRFGVIPNASRFYMTGKSQPPFLTSMIFDIYDHALQAADGDAKVAASSAVTTHWLTSRMDIAKEEYRKVWMGITHPHWRQVYEGLSRYYHVDVLHDLAETESGWDMNPRFLRKCIDYIPVDLNILLYKYETDFAKAAEIAGDDNEAKEWLKRAKKRKATVDKYLWNETEGFYFDYNYRTGEQSPVWSLAAYYALWAGMASEEQAARLVANLDKFEYIGGLSCVAAVPKISHIVPLQWDYPNGWAPLELLAIQGLERYGYHHEAERLAKKWLITNLITFLDQGVFYEKYNVVNPYNPPKEGVYPSQTGFGWTNAVFYKLANDYRYLYASEASKNETSASPLPSYLQMKK